MVWLGWVGLRFGEGVLVGSVRDVQRFRGGWFGSGGFGKGFRVW